MTVRDRGREEHASVLQYPVAVDADRIAGELPLSYDQVVAALERGFHPESPQCGYDGGRETAEHGGGVLTRDFLVDECVIDIAKVVEYRPASCHSAYHRDAVALDVFRVDLGCGVLVTAYNYGWSISPKAENRLFNAGQQELFCCKVPVRVCGGVCDAEHGSMSIFWKF